MAGVFDVAADGTSGAAGLGKIEPSGVGLAVRGRDDFHRVARF